VSFVLITYFRHFVNKKGREKQEMLIIINIKKYVC